MLAIQLMVSQPVATRTLYRPICVGCPYQHPEPVAHIQCIMQVRLNLIMTRLHHELDSGYLCLCGHRNKEVRNNT